jgi:1-acyl-sn-glycerol-3-phosphate acyltransferase
LEKVLNDKRRAKQFSAFSFSEGAALNPMNSMLFAVLESIRSGVVWYLVGIITIPYFLVVLAAFLVTAPFDPTRNRLHGLISGWGKIILFLCPLMTVKLEGDENLKPGETYIFVANHQSLVDILAVLQLKHPFKFIAKRELFYIPFFGWGLYLAGYIPLVRGDRVSGKQAVEKAQRYLKCGASVLLFPEGTRSRDGEIQEFKIGAFKLSTELNIPVVPIVIDGTLSMLPKGSKSFGKGVKVCVKVGLPRLAAGSGTEAAQKLSDSVRREMIQTLAELRAHT